MKSTNNYDTIINAWKSIVLYYNRNSGGKYALAMPPAMFVLCEMHSIFSDKYQPINISYCSTLDTFDLHYEFSNIVVEISIGASEMYIDAEQETICLSFTVKPTGFNAIFAACRMTMLKPIFDELEKIDSWERGSNLDEAILKLIALVGE